MASNFEIQGGKPSGILEKFVRFEEYEANFLVGRCL